MWSPWKTHWALALVKGIREPHEVKKNSFWPRWESIPTNNPRQKSWHACPLFQYLSRQFISSPPSPQFNVAYRDEIATSHFQHCQGGRGFLIPLMPLVIVSKIACQRMFQLSDPGMLRTFVEDCICVTRRDYDMFSGKIRKRAPCFVWFCDGIDFDGTTNVLGSSIFLLIMILYILRKHVKVHWCCLNFQRRSIQILNEKGISLPVVSLFFTMP